MTIYGFCKKKKKKLGLKFPRQLTTEVSIIRQLTVERHFCNLHVFFSLSKCVYNNFLEQLLTIHFGENVIE